MNDQTAFPILERSWCRAWQHLELIPPTGLFEQLLAAYSEPQRHYHTLQHLAECIDHFETAMSDTHNPGEIEIALWFHDAIYDIQGKNNEQRSANWAVEALTESGAAGPLCQRIVELILATRHDVLPIDSDQQLLVDIDLSILGASSRRFAEYNEQVRAEYAWVPEIVYRMKRKEVLAGFLARPFIYSSFHFRELCERQARANLQDAITAL